MLPALLFVAALGAPVGTLVRYEIVESMRALTPSGPRNRALAGTVSALGGKARWELSGGHFPGVAARSAIADGGALVLLDPEASLATPVSREEFEGLFQSPQGPAGSSSASIRDLSASVARDGNGAPFDGSQTERWSVRCKYTLVSAQPGRVVRVTVEVSGTIETIPEPAAPRTPFDDLLRLFHARGEVREALAAQLLKVTGLPVKVRLDSSTEALAEAVGAPGGAEAPAPVRASSTTTRTVSNLSRRPAAEGDEALFAVPESYRSLPLERARTEAPPLR